MIDITMYGDNELSLIVNDTVSLYAISMRSFEDLLNLLKSFYLYTDKQLEVLKDDYDYIG